MNHHPTLLKPAVCIMILFFIQNKCNVPLSMQVCTQQITETKKQVSLNKKQNKKHKNPIKQNFTTTNIVNSLNALQS